MALDLNEPYQFHAFTALGFVCDDCDAAVDDPPGSPSSDEWRVALAGAAKTAGFYVPPAENGRAVDGFTCYCGSCAVKRGLSVTTA